MIPRTAATTLRSRPFRRGFLLLSLLGAGVALSVPALPARPLPGIPVFTYSHPARHMPPALPGEAVVLTIESGSLRKPLTLRQLKSLPAVRYRTNHMQLHQDYTYEGVALRDLAILGGFSGQNLRIAAANGFASTILASDYMNYPIMLAYSADGNPIPTLKKGPLTVVLPARPERFHEGTYSAAWVWFAERITPVP